MFRQFVLIQSIFRFALLTLLIGFMTALPGQVGFAAPKPDPTAVFPVETLSIETSSGVFEFSVEIADDVDERARGLMFRETMLPTHGMLFDFGENSVVNMWMKNTPLSLDMVFIKPDGKIARVETNTKPFSLGIITSGEPVSHVLELRAGMARQIGLKRGDFLNHRFFDAKD